MRQQRSFDPARRVLSSPTATEEQKAAARADLDDQLYPEGPPALQALSGFGAALLLVVLIVLLIWGGLETYWAIQRLWVEHSELSRLAYQMRAM